MTLPQKTTVLIVGAGPSGLSAAISLLHHGCKDIAIVDAAERTLLTSRAMVIHAATLEALEGVGCVEPLNALGIKAKGPQIGDRKSIFFSVDISSIKTWTKYPHVLILPQHITERTLEDRLGQLGVHVSRPCKAVGMKPSDIDGMTDVTFDSGEVVTARYVIGADGARSAIRQMAGISFDDPDGESIDQANQIVLADVTFDTQEPLTQSALRAVPSDGQFFFIATMPNLYDGVEGLVYRIGFSVDSSSGPPPSNPSMSYLQEHVDKQGPHTISSDQSVNPSPVKIAVVIWSTRFRTHSAIASKLLTKVRAEGREGGDVFLVGDAAHIHSPAGGLGMNLGIRDAIGLGPAIIQDLQLGQNDDDGKPSQSSPLEAYAVLRHKHALETIHLSKKALRLILLMANSHMFNLNLRLIGLLTKLPFVMRRFAWQVSGLGSP